MVPKISSNFVITDNTFGASENRDRSDVLDSLSLFGFLSISLERRTRSSGRAASLRYRDVYCREESEQFLRKVVNRSPHTKPPLNEGGF